MTPPEEHIHDWESGAWGVILGVSRCRACGEVARVRDFPETLRDAIADPTPQGRP